MHLSKISLALRQWGAGAWSPSFLFASGEQGVIYDNSEVDEYLAGLTLSSEILTNADFSNGSTGWTLGTGWAVADGKATHSGGSSSNISQATVVAQMPLVITYTVTENVGGRGLELDGG
ncbi:MAG: hypothetical protein WAR79_08065, partial [Melioribacteraceae bacterium]